MLRGLANRLQRGMGLAGVSGQVDRAVVEARIAAGFSRGACTLATRAVDHTRPQTWEFGAFSQHGEDGILEYLIRHLKSSDRYFLEIASGDGLENCTAYLALGSKWTGVMVEGDAALAAHCRRVYQGRVWNVIVKECYVHLENIADILAMLPTKDFDVFSLDIDSIDFHIMKAAMSLGYRPKILVVEYNSAFGPEKAVTVPYKPEFNRWSEHPSGVYYGVSIMAWRHLLEPLGYHFVTVDSSGTNAFFANPGYFDEGFLKDLKPTAFLNNATDMNPTTTASGGGGEIRNLRLPRWEEQFQHFAGKPLETVTAPTAKGLS